VVKNSHLAKVVINNLAGGAYRDIARVGVGMEEPSFIDLGIQGSQQAFGDIGRF